MTTLGERFSGDNLGSGVVARDVTVIGWPDRRWPSRTSTQTAVLREMIMLKPVIPPLNAVTTRKIRDVEDRTSLVPRTVHAEVPDAGDVGLKRIFVRRVDGG
jgi:hypothetical protein